MQLSNYQKSDNIIIATILIIFVGYFFGTIESNLLNETIELQDDIIVSLYEQIDNLQVIVKEQNENTDNTEQITNEIDYEKIETMIKENQAHTEKDFGEKFEEMTSYFGDKIKDIAVDIDKVLKK